MKKFSNRNNVIVGLLGSVSIMSLMALTSANPELASTLGINTYAAKRAIDMISAAGDVMAIIGLIGAVTGAGAIGAGLVFTAKKMIKSYGKKYASAW